VSNFDRAFTIVVGIEGGLVNDPKDPGGVTKYGISKRQYPDVDIANLTVEQAKAIYLRDYWNTHDLDSLEYGKALLVFDTAVNGGNHQRWYSMYGGYAMEDFAQAFQAEHMLYLASLPGWINYGRGWSRRALKIYGESLKP
jgi:lysozyme family protein